MRALWLIPLAAFLVGCSREEGPVGRAAGSWPGEFRIESVDGSEDKTAIGAEATKGNLHLYATGMKYRLEMNRRNQSFTITGKWKAEKNRVTMTADNYEFQNPTEEDQKALSMKLLVGSSRVDLQACKLEYSIVSPK